MKNILGYLVYFGIFLGIISITGCNKDPELPVLTTADVTNIAINSGTTGGNITDNGGADITARGVCWSTSRTPVIEGSHTVDGKGSGSFSSDIDNLTPNTLYYLRAYATNSVGTAYGNEISFTTAAIVVPALTTAVISATTLTTASSGGNISADGGAAVTARGVCWATSANPVVSNDKTTDGTGTGAYTSNLTGLAPGTTYYVRAYATNSAGTAYGNEISFATNPVAVPTLTTTAATDITLTTASSGGNISADGGGAVTARGVCWATSANPTVSNNKTTDGAGSGVFTSNLTGLAPGTTYYVRAYATNSAGTAYGNEILFPTNPVVVPTLTTTGVTSITLNTAVSGGNISADGGGNVTARGVCWATTTNPTTSNSTATGGTGTGSFSSNLTGLAPGVTYYVRAYAINSAGTAYGNEVSFTTNPVSLPSLTTTPASSINLTTAVSGGNISSNGGGTITVSGICWSTSANPTTADNRTTDGTGASSFTSTMTGLSAATTYYTRAYATNSAGTAYGNQITFNTKIADIEGNTYNIINIGTQVWMVENLKTTRLNDNTPIPNVTDNTNWTTLSTSAYCWYGNNIANKALHGALYNWFTINTGNLCPSGWHVASDGEFKTLELHLGLDPAQIDLWGWRGTDQGAQMKTTSGWAGGGNGTNTSGFSGLPGGYRFAATGTFNDLGNLTYWWSSNEDDLTRAWYRRLDAANSDIYRASTEKRGGKYVRCVKN